MRLLLPLLAVFASGTALAGAGTLPQGVGLIQVGARNYGAQTDAFDETGARGPIGSHYSLDLSGASLKAGSGGSDLQRLATEIDKVDPGAGTDHALLDDLSVGHIETDVRGTVRAEFLGVAYGVTNRWTVFAGVPYVHAAVDANLVYSGQNNALAIKQQLGGYAYGALQSGLDQAAAVNLAQVNAAFDSYGYNPMGHWQRDGVGDLQVGARTGLSQRFRYGFTGDLVVVPSLSVPTGYVKDADTLQAVSFGSGAYALATEVDPTLSWHGLAHAGLPMVYQHNFETSVEKRVPVADEALEGPDRKARVKLDPGDDVDLGASLGGGTKLVDVDVQHGMKRHYGDRYSGSLEGNYAGLSRESDTVEYYRLVTLKVDTTSLYLRRRFAVPFIVGVSAYQTLAGRNVYDERYYQLSFSTFFSAGGRH